MIVCFKANSLRMLFYCGEKFAIESTKSRCTIEKVVAKKNFTAYEPTKSNNSKYLHLHQAKNASCIKERKNEACLDSLCVRAGGGGGRR